MENKENGKWIYMDEEVTKNLAEALKCVKDFAQALKKGYSTVDPMSKKCLSSDMSWEETRLYYAEKLQFIVFFLKALL